MDASPVPQFLIGVAGSEKHLSRLLVEIKSQSTVTLGFFSFTEIAQSVCTFIFGIIALNLGSNF